MSRVAAVQMSSGPQVPANLVTARRLIEQAALEMADVVVVPENFCLMPLNDADRARAAETIGDGPIQEFLADNARRCGVWVVGGTVPICEPGHGRVRSACLVYDDAGRRVARYDKIHLFDVALANGELYRESDYIAPGAELVTVNAPVGCVGLTICYDVRFPELYRLLLDRGAELFTVPSAFTATTGAAHWEVLLRARAVENLAYVVAPAQVGSHANGRCTYGHSMIIDPWGTIVSAMTEGEGVVTADIERDRLQETRTRFPTLDHRKLGTIGSQPEKHTTAKWTLREHFAKTGR